MTSIFHQKWQVVGSSLEISLSKTIGGKAAYYDFTQNPQKWDFCALGTTFF